MRSVESHLQDALICLMEARDRAQLFQYDEKEIERLKLLIRATHKTKKEITEGHLCELSANSKV